MYPIVISKKESGSCNKWWLISNMLYKKKNCYTFCRNTDLIVYFILRYPKMFDLWFLEIWFGLQKNVIKNLKGYETSKRYISKQSYIRFKIHTRNLNALLYHNDNIAQRFRITEIHWNVVTNATHYHNSFWKLWNVKEFIMKEVNEV